MRAAFRPLAFTSRALSINGAMGALCLLGALLDGCVQEPSGTYPYNPASPVVIRTDPVHLDSNVALNTVVTATFSEPMHPDSLNERTFLLLRPKLGGGFDTVDGTVSYNPGDTTATFNPAAPLFPGALYRAVITTSAVDAACDPPDTAFTWTFTTPAPDPDPDPDPDPEPDPCIDQPAPAITLTSPATGQGNVALNAAVTVTFSAAMDPASINATTFTVVLASGFGPVPVPGTVSYDAGMKTATFVPNSNLNPLSTYTVTINALTPAGICPAQGADTIWSFSTRAPDPDPDPEPDPCIDQPAPAITLTSPATGQGNVALNAAVTVTFSTAMDPASINAATFTVVTQLGGTPVPGTVSYNAGTKTATFTPTGNFDAATGYTVSITATTPGGACPALETDTLWTFTTLAPDPDPDPEPDPCADPPLPTITSAYPNANGTDVAVDALIIVTFSTAMDPASINAATFTVVTQLGGTPVPGTVSYNAGTKTVTFTPTGNFDAATGYTVSIDATTLDGICGPLGVNDTWSFTTIASDGGGDPCSDPPNPTIIFASPGADETEVALDAAVTVTFSIAMDPATINSASFTVTTGATPVAGTVSYDPVTFTASFLPDVALDPLSEYIVSISALTPDGGICPPGSVDASWTFTSLAPP